MSDDSDLPRLDSEDAEKAKDAYAESLDEIAGLSSDGQVYLAGVAELPDPETDGLACGEYYDTGI